MKFAIAAIIVIVSVFSYIAAVNHKEPKIKAFGCEDIPCVRNAKELREIENG